MTVTFKLNGDRVQFYGDPMTSLVDVLRNERYLTGTKSVCQEGFCGACTVHVNGKPTMSCLTPVGLINDRDIKTIEGMSSGRQPLHPLQAALEAADVVQCGMCFPGMVMSLSSFLDENPQATRPQIKAAMTGNICRCTGYERIIDAIVGYQETQNVSLETKEVAHV